MNKDDKNKENKPSDTKDKKSDMMTMSDMDMQPTKNDMPMGGMDQQPMSGNDDQPKGRRPRQQTGEPKEKDGQTKKSGMNTGNKQEPQPMTGTQTKDPKNTGGARPDPDGDPKNPAGPSIPFEDEIVKDVWGHLPLKLRQQASQYYQQEFMARYSELLKHYYSSLSEKGGKK
jgi:hypothetical protein